MREMRVFLDSSVLISTHDAPILASALAHSDCLLTLDNEFFKADIMARAKNNDLAILKHGDLIKMLGM